MTKKMILTQKLGEKGSPKICPVAVICKGGKILIGLRHYTPDKYKKISVWTLPGGRCDDGEPVEKTLRREILEEVGIDDMVFKKYLGKAAGAKKGDVVYLFLGSTRQKPRLLEPEKFSAWRWVKAADIPANFINRAVLKLIPGSFEKPL